MQIKDTVTCTGANGRFVIGIGYKTELPFIPAELAPGLTVQVDNRCQPGGHRHQITIDIERITIDLGCIGIDPRRLDAADMAAALSSNQRVTGVNSDLPLHRLGDKRARRRGTHIDNRPDINTGIGHGKGCAIGIIMGGDNNCPPPRNNTITIDIGPDST